MDSYTSTKISKITNNFFLLFSLFPFGFVFYISTCPSNEYLWSCTCSIEISWVLLAFQIKENHMCMKSPSNCMKTQDQRIRKRQSTKTTHFHKLVCSDTFSFEYVPCHYKPACCTKFEFSIMTVRWKKVNRVSLQNQGRQSHFVVIAFSSFFPTETYFIQNIFQINLRSYQFISCTYNSC